MCKTVLTKSRVCNGRSRTTPGRSHRRCRIRVVKWINVTPADAALPVLNFEAIIPERTKIDVPVYLNDKAFAR